MKKIKHIIITLIVIALVIAVALGWNLLTNKQIITIVKSVEIPGNYNETGEGNGSCGILMLSGNIVMINGKVEYIEFISLKLRRA